MVGVPSSTSKWTIGLAVLTAFAVGTAVGLIVAPTQAPVTKSDCPKCTATPTAAAATETATHAPPVPVPALSAGASASAVSRSSVPASSATSPSAWVIA